MMDKYDSLKPHKEMINAIGSRKVRWGRVARLKVRSYRFPYSLSVVVT
jgi:hypothetical protein